MDKLGLIRGKLLELGIDSISSYDKARLEYVRRGDESALNDLIKAAILFHGICQIAEFTGIASYDEFELELVQDRQEPGPIPGSSVRRHGMAHASDMLNDAFSILREKQKTTAHPVAAQRD